MSYLKLSDLPDIKRYRADGSIDDADCVEISLYRGLTTQGGIGKYVSSKVPILDLKNYLNANIQVETSSMADFSLFDICYRLCLDTPILASIYAGTDFIGNIYSHWPLFIDKSNNSPDWNTTAPNWLNKCYITDYHKNISEIYPDFWSLLLSHKQHGYIKFDLVDVGIPTSITSSTYMSEVNTLGYTGRFLIDETNKFVALPVLNGSFLGCPSASAESLSSVSDSFSSHHHPITVNVQNPLGSTTDNCSFEINSILSKASNNTFETDETIAPSADFDSSTHPKYIDIAPFMCISNNISTSELSTSYETDGVDILPAGTILSFALPTPPQNWLVCSGQMLYVSEYPELAAAFGHDLSAGTFYVPDLRDRFPTQDLDNTTEYISDNSSTLLNHHHGIGNNINFISRGWTVPTKIEVMNHNLRCSTNISQYLQDGSIHTLYPQYKSTNKTPNIFNMINFCILLPCIKATNG